MISATHWMRVVTYDGHSVPHTNSLRMKAPTGAKPGLITTTQPS
jgi:hypothetical protein